MYCILNQSDDIIASDLEFLNLFQTNSLVDLYKMITAQNAKISLDYDKITITANSNINTYDIKLTPLTTLFGKSVLVELMSSNIKNEFIEVPNLDIAKVHTEPDVAVQETPAQEESEIEIKEATTPNLAHEEEIEAGIELQTIENVIAEEAQTEETEINPELQHFIHSKVTLDIPDIAKSMHLSDDDYRVFLGEYTSSIEKFKNDLESDNEDAKNNAISFIKHITTALHLPKEIEDLVNSLNAGSSKELMQNFLDVIDDIKEQNSESVPSAKNEYPANEEHLEIEYIAIDKAEEKAEIKDEPKATSSDELSIDIIHDTASSYDAKPQVAVQETAPAINIADSIEIDMPGDIADKQPEAISKPEKITTAKSGAIDLSSVKPSPFDFILDESAKELSLPVDIVKEFIKDFIEQCHTDTDKITHKYNDGDIEKIKKLAHSLKGVASNLYIMPLADTLLELQNNDDLSEVKPLVEKYWGQFLYLENIMKNI